MAYQTKANCICSVDQHSLAKVAICECYFCSYKPWLTITYGKAIDRIFHRRYIQIPRTQLRGTLFVRWYDRFSLCPCTSTQTPRSADHSIHEYTVWIIPRNNLKTISSWGFLQSNKTADHQFLGWCQLPLSCRCRMSLRHLCAKLLLTSSTFV